MSTKAGIETPRLSSYHHIGTIEETGNGFKAVCECKGRSVKWRSKEVPYRTEAMELLKEHYGLTDENEEDEWDLKRKR